MSHFTVLVIGENPEEQLAPFYEGLEVPRYVKNTKEELIAKERAFLEEYRKSTYQQFLNDIEAYKKSSLNKDHIHFLEEIFPKLLKYSDEELYLHTTQFYEPETIGKNGEIYSTYNPKSKWDWYQLGGRWEGYFTLKLGSKADTALRCQIKEPIPPTFAVLKQGEWYEKGKIGWWAMVADEKSDEDWNKEFQDMIDSVPEDTLFSLYDCHI